MKHYITVLIAVMSLCLAVLVTSFTTVKPHDYWWHLKVGQIVSEQGVPSRNIFSWTVPADKPYIYGEWLGGWLLYQSHHNGGYITPVIIRNILGFTAVFLINVMCFWRCRSYLISSAVLIYSCILIYNNLHLRPQIWSWPPITSYALFLVQKRHNPLLVTQKQNILIQICVYIVILPAIMVFWVNVHGSFVIGLVIYGIVIAGSIFELLSSHRTSRNWRRINVLLIGGLLTLIATLINPIGPNIYVYIWSIATDSAIHSYIQEWQPPLWYRPAGASFYLSVALFLGLGLFRWRRLSITDGLLVVVFTVLACMSLRSVFWYTLIAMPILAQLLVPNPKQSTDTGFRTNRPSTLGITPRGRSPRKQSLSASQPKNQVVLLEVSQPSKLSPWLAVPVVIVFVLAQPPLRGVIPWQSVLHQDVIDLPGAPGTYSRDTPVAATAYLQQHPHSGRVFNDVGVGSYLIWAMGEDLPLFIDPRVELFPQSVWEDYLTISSSPRYNDLLIGKYDISRVILNRYYELPLSRYLIDDPRWERVYTDGIIEIYDRVSQ